MNTYDVLIVGGGPAGLNAALVLLRARRRVAVVDAGHPRNAPAANMHGFLSRDGMPPAELLAAGRTELSRYGGTVIDGTVVDLAPGFVATLGDGSTLAARRVLVTTGLRDSIPDIPGVSSRWGRDVLHCPYCHGYEVRDQPLGVLGGDPAAIAHAVLLRQWSDDVVLFVGDEEPESEHLETLRARDVAIRRGRVRQLVVEEDTLRGVELENGDFVARTALFVRPTFTPHDTLLHALGCATDDQGWTAHDDLGATSVPGVYVAGNVADPRAQVITSAGQGSAVGIAMNAALVTEDVETALQQRL
ncbi:NAD(P)/FAD-dependent oxidoreductase [uncultured Microbacterium sp.]|uniref:FAD-dependent pyridine nucleotide-disulphide oxidoreductase n=1 Tax=uncultured Microbacterium sp. TaxID=191216 RepID=A0A1Y5NZI4_9MICO|nr:NAD(P)/FAD-dependent oxidoreductase [uncultured Microbacterium sp.]SBS71775.1 FAD-dependent pyridine nucleotide-disulphide oxidoreductase [uncultured Microbacterium sp.]